jgi:hypothetical protein
VRWPCSLESSAVLMLRFHADLTEADTARAQNISIGAVKSYTTRALATRTGRSDRQSWTATTVFRIAGSVRPIVSARSVSASGSRAPTIASRSIRPAAAKAIASG